MMTLSDEQLEFLCQHIPDSVPGPQGGRPVADKALTVAGIFWILDNGAKWKSLPARFGSKSTVHRWFMKWTRAGVLERVLRAAGRCVQERSGFKIYECFIDGTFAKAKGGGDGIGCTKAGKGVKIMIIVDADGLPVAIDSGPANPHESTLVQGLFDFMLGDQTPLRLIGDKAYDSDKLAEELMLRDCELIAPHRSNRSPQTKTQDGRPLRRYKRRWRVERTIAWLQNYRRLCIRWEKSSKAFQGFLHLACTLLLIKTVLG